MVLKEADFHFGWEVQIYLHFSTLLTLITMKKHLILTCLFLLAIAGVKAQTYCYHIYKKYDKNDIPQSVNGYQYLTFKGDFMYRSEKDGSYQIIEGTHVKNLYKFLKRIEGGMIYAEWNDYANNYQDEINKQYGVCFIGLTYYLVSEDRSEINYLYKRSNEISEPFTLCFERCPNEDCDGPKTPVMKH